MLLNISFVDTTNGIHLKNNGHPETNNTNLKFVWVQSFLSIPDTSEQKEEKERGLEKKNNNLLHIDLDLTQLGKMSSFLKLL